MSRHPVPEVLYVGGYGRSGSTLLDVLVAERSGAISGGEVWRLFSEAAQDRSCSCGTVLSACPFWGPVLDSVTQELGMSLDELHTKSLTIDFSRGSSRDWESVWGAVFTAIAARHGQVRLVDSSKTSGGMVRVSRIDQSPSVRLAGFIHLTRALPAVLYSLGRGSNRAIEHDPRTTGSSMAMVRGTVGWVRAHAAARGFVRGSAVPAVTVRYEALSRHPDDVVRQALLRIGWPSAESGTDTTAHVVGGNRFVRGEWSGKVHADEAWRDHLPRRWWVLGRGVDRIARAAGLLG